MTEKQYKESDKNRADEPVKHLIGYQLCFAFVIRLFAHQFQHDFRFVQGIILFSFVKPRLI